MTRPANEDLLSLMEHISSLVDSLAWPVVVLVALWFLKSELRQLLATISGAKLPGGVSLDFDKRIRHVAKLESQVREKLQSTSPIELSRADINQRLIAAGLVPSPTNFDLSGYRETAGEEPAAALIAIRGEVQSMVESLLKFKEFLPRSESLSKKIAILYQLRLINRHEFNLSRTVVDLCNDAAKGHKVRSRQAYEVIDAVSVLAQAFAQWLMNDKAVTELIEQRAQTMA